MSGNNSISPRSARANAAVGSPLAPESRARQALDAKRFREAVELYKGLLKQERRPERVDGLAESYAGRGRELAAKGMFAEALVVWRNRASLCGRPLVDGPYLDWLLGAGEHDGALRLLAAVGDPSPTGADLEARLAAVALTAPDSALAQVPLESPLRRHRPAVLAALAAYCRGDQSDLDERLRAIPFRSPYRDLRLILKSLSLLGDDTAQAAELIARIGHDSPFERLAAVARAAILTGSAWLVALLDLDDEGRQLLLDLKGCPENRRSLLLEVAELARTATPLQPATVVNLLLRRSRGLPATAAKLCRRLLPFAAKRLEDYRNAFGSLTEAERESLLARGAETTNDEHGIGRHWLRAAALYSQREAAPLQAALILRHLFEIVAGSGDMPDSDSECITWLERSLEFDPDDRATHLKLIRIHRQNNELRAARASVDTALARFPNDPAVLLEAVETALAGNAFKKAVALAKRLLELDPINSRVRALIGQAHLAHARKQIRSRRTEAACKELALAEEWLTVAHERSIAKLLRGLSARTPQADALLREAASELGGQLSAAFHLLLESLRVGDDAAGVLRRAGIALSGTSTPREVAAVMHASNALAAADKRKLQAVFDTLRAQLLRSVNGAFSESERIAVCEAALRWNESGLLRAYADAGLKGVPAARPIFVYFAIFGRYGDAAHWRMSDHERRTVEAALAKAEQDGDQRTVLRIRELSQSPRAFPGEDADDASDFLDDLSLPPRAVFELLIAMGGHEELIRMAREVVPASVFRPLERVAGGNRKKLAELLLARLAELDPSFLDAVTPREVPVTKPRAPSPRRERPVVDDRQKGLFDD